MFKCFSRLCSCLPFCKTQKAACPITKNMPIDTSRIFDAAKPMLKSGMISKKLVLLGLTGFAIGYFLHNQDKDTAPTGYVGKNH